MAKRTISKLKRTYKDVKQMPQGIMVGQDGSLSVFRSDELTTVKFPVVLSASPSVQSQCRVCLRLIDHAEGTIAKYHGECRKYKKGGYHAIPDSHLVAMREKYGSLQNKTIASS